jgi:hypothetical protein
MSTLRPDKVFGRYNEFVLLCLGFLLTTVLGTFLTSRYQDRARLSVERATRLEAALNRATTVSEEISRTLDRRLYRTRVLVWALMEHKPEAELQAARDNYLKAKDDWNENLNRLYSAVESSFGNSQRVRLEGDLTERFRTIHNSIDACLKDRAKCDIAKINADINAFNPEIYAFDAGLLEQIKLGTVGAFGKQ